MSNFITNTGRIVDINNFDVDSVCIDDIAHHLARIQRFGGALPMNMSYSVGEHCINMANHFKNTIYQKAALMHDATEAYISDLISPVKQYLHSYKALEDKLADIIFKKYGINTKHLADIKSADKRIMLDEVRELIPRRYDVYRQTIDLPPLNCEIIHSQHPSTIKQCFLTLCTQLGIKD